jgi:hypothetical protein
MQSSFFAAGIYESNYAFGGTLGVEVTSSGQLVTLKSSRRYKEDIRDMDDDSLGLLRLRPVTFRYKQPYADGSKPIQYGLIAEEVAEVYPDLVARSTDGQIDSVRYQVLVPMLLNEVQKQAEQNRQQTEEIRRQAEVNQLQQEENRKLEDRLAALEALLSDPRG